MSMQRVVTILAKQHRALCLQAFNRTCHQLYKRPFKQKPYSLSEQSVLLPGKERIRSSVLLDDPNVLVSEIPDSPHVKTVYDCLLHGMKASENGHCIGSKNPNTGEYEWMSYSEVVEMTQKIGSAFIQLGLEPRNDTFVGIFATNRQEFLLTLYACAAYSMVTVPLYITLGLQSVLYIINQAGLRLVIVNNEENALKVLKNVKQIPSVKSMVMVDPITPQIQQLAKDENIDLFPYSVLEDIGRNSKKELMLPNTDDLFCIPYTSGTTGIPKGVMLTHNNMISCIAGLRMQYGEAGKLGGTILSYLPPAHIYEITNEVASIFFARRIAFYSGDVRQLVDEVKFLKPTILTLVPRLMNILYATTMDSLKGSFFKSFLLRVALRRKKTLMERGKVSNETLWDKLVFRKFQEILGGRAHMIITTSAPISPEVVTFFRCASGAYVLEAYGQSETLASVQTLPRDSEGGSTGAPTPCNFVKLVDVPEMGYFSKDDFGEVCIKGPNVFKGYFKDEKNTRESLIDGWQHTGDIGRWLPNGTLKIIDRKKHLFKLSQGEYIAPEKVENVYSQSNLVLQVLVDGLSDQNYVVALVVPEPTALKGWLRSKGYKDTENLNQIFSNKEVRKNFLLELRKIGKQKDLNSLEQVKNIALLSEPFSVDNEILSPTFKIRRGHARKYFEGIIRSLYEEGPIV